MKSFLFFIPSISDCWQPKFDFQPCYSQRMEERMPLSIDNLIAIIEAFEREYQNTPAENIAEAIIKRYVQVLKILCLSDNIYANRRYSLQSGSNAFHTRENKYLSGKSMYFSNVKSNFQFFLDQRFIFHTILESFNYFFE